MSEPSLLTESRAVGEYWQLIFDPIFRGEGVPPGSGDLVILLPGLFANDGYLLPLRDWLQRIGYRPALSTIPLNVGCPERLQQRVLSNLDVRISSTDSPVAIIGHSRGGMLGKALASRLGARCTRLIAVGSPLGGALRVGGEGVLNLMQPKGTDLAARPVANAGRMAMRIFSPDCRFPACECGYLDDLLEPLATTTRVTSIYSEDDPVVAPAAAVIDGAANIQVRGSHAGLVANRRVYRAIADALAG